MPDSDWWQALWPDPTAVLRAVGVGAGMGAVDLCCGNGYFTAPMCRLVYPGETWAFDLDADLLGQAIGACRDQPNFHAVLGDARDLPRHVGNQMDFVFIANTFHGVPDTLGLSWAVCDSLKPGGRFAIVNWHRRPREETLVLGQPRGPDTVLRMAPTDVCRVVEPAGFTLSVVVDVGPYHYGAVFRRSESI
jgi:SAM-dependent methyltransferase